jgi:A/G-specific adenine glycosylase
MNAALPASFSDRSIALLRRNLLAWFDSHRRDLPWRTDRDPYRIWVSEVMLQQTTVAAVRPRFERFVTALPTVQALAAADEQRVLKLWEGLGYYRRARHLHAAAQQIIEIHDGNLPEDPATWAELPGVGRYIMGAVLSQAFDRRLPIVEANSLRVLSRLFGYRGNPRAGDGSAWIWNAAEALLPSRRVGDFNQALMELGALVCTPSAPACASCPLRGRCRAHRHGLQAVIPIKKATRAVEEVREAAVAIHDRGRVLLGRRPAGATRWQDMWEVPHAEIATGEEPVHAAAGIAKELTGLEVTIGEELCVIRHRVTRFSITMTCREAKRLRGRPRSRFYSELRWVAMDELPKYPVSSPQRRLMTALAARRISTK